jgi:multiple antibiotic resistance protein
VDVCHSGHFLFFGRFVLYFFGISLPVLKIAGGMIVANTAWSMVTSHAGMTPEESHEAEDKADISLTLLAMPLMPGPGTIGVVMALGAHVDSAVSYLGMVIGITGIALPVLLFFWLGGPLVAAALGPVGSEPSTRFLARSFLPSPSNWYGMAWPTSRPRPL